MNDKAARRKKFQGDVSEALALLQVGRMDVEGLVPWSSNYTFLVKIRDDAREMLAIYKPSRGERPLWDFPDGTLAKREVASYMVSAALGWPHIPPSVLRDGPEGEGVVQQFIETVDEQHFFTLRYTHRDEMKRIAAFDAIVNNTDRKGGHVLLGKDGCIWCIDHGVTFHEYPKLRTVIWDFTEQRIPAEILQDIRDLQSCLRRASDNLTASLSLLISRREMKALRQRIDELIERGVYPSPPEDWPPVPWPPV